MKKLFALFIGLAALQTVACADDKPIALKDLPAAAQQFLKQYFPDVKATYAKVDNDLWGKNYDVLWPTAAVSNSTRTATGPMSAAKLHKCPPR